MPNNTYHEAVSWRNTLRKNAHSSAPVTLLLLLVAANLPFADA